MIFVVFNPSPPLIKSVSVNGESENNLSLFDLDFSGTFFSEEFSVEFELLLFNSLDSSEKEGKEG